MIGNEDILSNSIDFFIRLKNLIISILAGLDDFAGFLIRSTTFNKTSTWKTFKFIAIIISIANDNQAICTKKIGKLVKNEINVDYGGGESASWNLMDDKFKSRLMVAVRLVVSAVALQSSVAKGILEDTNGNLGKNPLKSLHLHLQTKRSRRPFNDNEYFTITNRNPTSSKSLAEITADSLKNRGSSSTETVDLIYQRFAKNESPTTIPVQFSYLLSSEMACATRLLVESYGKDGMRGIPVESLSESHLIAFIDGLRD